MPSILGQAKLKKMIYIIMRLVVLPYIFRGAAFTIMKQRPSIFSWSKAAPPRRRDAATMRQKSR